MGCSVWLKRLSDFAGKCIFPGAFGGYGSKNRIVIRCAIDNLPPMEQVSRVALIELLFLALYLDDSAFARGLMA